MSWSLRRIFSSLTPRGLARWRYVLWQLHPAERRALLRWVVAQYLGRGADWRAALGRARSVTLVCHGNIIRSPLAAEALARAARERSLGVLVRSAGLVARPGERADPRALASAQERGYSLEAHRSRLFDEREAHDSDVIFAMDLPNVGRILGAWPGAAGKVFLLAGLEPSGQMRLREIYDPVVGTLDDVRQAHDEVLRGVAVAVESLPRR